MRSRLSAATERMTAAPGLLPSEARNRRLYRSAFEASEGLKAYADAIPPADALEQPQDFAGAPDQTYRSELRRQAQLTVLAFKSGVAVSADLWLGGFDTHDDNDANGTIIYPKHVHKALRRYLGIENSPGAQRFPFNNTEDFDFFG